MILSKQRNKSLNSNDANLSNTVDIKPLLRKKKKTFQTPYYSCGRNWITKRYVPILK